MSEKIKVCNSNSSWAVMTALSSLSVEECAKIETDENDCLDVVFKVNGIDLPFSKVIDRILEEAINHESVKISGQLTGRLASARDLMSHIESTLEMFKEEIDNLVKES